MFSFQTINSIKKIFNISIKGFDDPSLRKYLYISLFLTFILTTLFCYLVYLFLDQYIFESLKFSSSNKFFNLILTSFIVQFIISIAQYFALWIFFSIILIPIGNLISSLFEEKIFDIAKEKNLYNFNKNRKSVTFIKSIILTIKLSLIAILVNIVLIPIYFFLPIANIIIFILVNGYLIGREFYGNILMQFYEKKEIRKYYVDSSSEVYAFGCLICFLYTVPVLNLFAPFFATLCFSHLLLQKEST